MDVEGARNSHPKDFGSLDRRARSGVSRGAAARLVKAPAPVLATGRAVGGRVVTGVARFVSSGKDLETFRPGEILMAEFTKPEWLAAMQTAAAIVTNRGGRMCHAAIASRKFGVPAVVGTIDGASRLWTGATLTVSCARGGIGRVYEGVLPSPIDGPATPKARPGRQVALPA